MDASFYWVDVTPWGNMTPELTFKINSNLTIED